jgi:hypothetical protein
MTKPDEKTSAPLPQIGLDEALYRFIQMDPHGLADSMARVRQAQAEVEKRAEKVRENIRRGLRPSGRKLGI